MKLSPPFNHGVSAKLALLTFFVLLAGSTLRAANPNITGSLSNTAITDEQTATPFSSATVHKGDTNLLTVFVNFAPTNLGTLSGAVQNGTNYSIGPTNEDAATTLLNALVFTPATNLIPVPNTSNVTFNVYIVDADDAGSATNDTIVEVTATNDVPTLIVGAPFTNSITDKTNTLVFTNVTIADVDDEGAQPVNVRIILDAMNKGTFTSLSGFTNTGTNYSFTGSPAAATTAIHALVFVPTPNRVLPGTSETTTFTIAVADGFSPPVTSSAYSVSALSINDAPTITAGLPLTNSITDQTNALVFTNTTVADVDLGGTQHVTVTIALDATNKGIFTSLSGFTNSGSNYVFTGTPAAATTAIHSLVFVPTPNHVPVDQTETTTFTILADDDFAAPVTNSSYSVTALSVNDAPQMTGVTTNHFLVQTGQGASPFSVVTLIDVDRNPDSNNISGEDITWTVALSGASPLGYLELNGANVGTNYSSAGDPAASTLGLRDLIYRAPTLPISGTNTLTLAVSAADSHGGTVSSNVLIDLYSVVLPPGLSGTQSGQIVNDNTTIAPFSHVGIQSFNGTSVTLQIRLAGGASNDVQGTLINLGSFSKTTNASSPSLYQFTGTSESATAAIRGLLFQPTPNRINGSSNELATFSITLIDGSITNNADTSTTVTVVPVNDVPVIAGISPLVTIQDNETLPPFTTVLVTDADELGQQTVGATITLDVAAKGAFSTNSLILSGFTSNNGSYTFSGAASNLTAAIRKLVFVPTPNRVAVGLTEITTFNINLNDGHGGIVANAGTSVRVASVSGLPVVNLPSPQPVSIPLGTNIFPFQQVSVSDSTALNLSVRINDSAQGAFTASSVTTSGFTNSGGGVYFVSGSASNVTAALTQLDFAPAPTLPLGATINFTISVTNALPNYVTVNHAIILRTVQNSFIVTKLTDYDPAAGVPISQKNGTLRKAIADAKNNDHITFDIRSAVAGQPDYPAVIRLVAPLVIDNNLTFDGPGAERLTISGDSDGNGTADIQLFFINAMVTMNRLTFTKGYAPFAGGAFEVSFFGDLKLSYCAVTDSIADVWGGGVDVDQGSLEMDHCLVSGNRTSSALGQGGGGISFYTYWPCKIVNTTFATNRQDAVGGLGGGAIYAETLDAGIEFDLHVLTCTFHDNRDNAGHGTSIRPNVFNTVIKLQNTIVADGQGKNIEMDQSGAVISLGGNISDDATSSMFSAGGTATNTFIFHPPADQVNVNVSNILYALANNGGPTLSFALSTNSTAIGNVVSNTPAAAFYSLLGTDQRGYFRDHNPDVGAFERGASQRIIIEELRFNPTPPNTNDEFIEFYVPRDSAALNVGGFKVLIDGTLRHTFTNQTLQPGQALVLFSSSAVSNGVPSGVYRQIAAGNLLMDNAGGVITLLNPSNQVVFVADYVGGFTSTDPNDYGFLSANYQSLVLCPQFQGVFLPYQRVVAKEGGSNTNGLANPGFDVLGNPLAVGNVPPLAYDDLNATDAHTLIPAIDVLQNDTDLDITDVIRVVAVGTNGNVSGTTNYSVLGARLIINNSPTTGASISYDPTASDFLTSLPQGSNVVDTFQYSILDSSNGVDHVRGVTAPEIALNLAKATAMVTVNVVGVNSAPTPQPDSVATRTNLTTAEDALLDFTTAVNLLANDLDPNSDDDNTTLNIISISDTNGYVPNRLSIITALGATVTLDIRFDRNETHITYDPRASSILNALGLNQTTNDTFYYSVKDGYDVIGTAPVQIQVTGVNDTPTANPDSFATDEDTILSISRAALRANDTDPDIGAVLTVSFVTPASAFGASVTIIGTNVIYDPTISTNLNALANKEFATDTFTYTVTDDHGLSSNAIVTLTIAGVNDRPVSSPDGFSTDEDSAFTNSAPGVLANDHDPDVNGLLPDDSIRVIPATNLTASGASVTMVADGSFAFDARGLYDWLKQDQQTNETFNYVMMDHSLSIANDDVFAATTSSETNILPVLANDSVLSLAGGSLQLTSVTVPNHGGTVALNAISNAVIYTPLAGYFGTETFSYTITDGLGGFDTASVTITLTASTLYANVDSFTVAKGTTNALDLLVNDTVLPVTGAAVSITAFGTPSLGGTISFNGVGPNNLLNYIPNPAQPTPFVETFTYTVTSASLVATGTVSVTVIDRSNSLTANNDNFTVITGSGNISLDVLANDLILPGPNTNLVITSFTTNSVLGTVSLNAAHTRLVYKPSNTISNQFEPVITYSISDNAGGTATASVTIQVVPSGFIANSDTFVVEKNSTNTLPVMVNDVILPNLGQTLYISGIGVGTNAPNHGGSVTINGSGTGLIYKPAANFTGAEDFTYEIADGGPSRALGYVHVIVMDNSLAASNPDTYRVARASANNLLPVLKNDYTLPKTPGAFTITGLQTNGVHATIALNGATANNTLLYTPNSGFIGRDIFSYEFVDTLGNRGTNQVFVTVGELYPLNDVFAVLSGSSTNLLDVRANDFIYPDASGVRVVTTVGTPDNGGTVAPAAVGTAVIYTPTGGFSGVEHFTYQSRDDSSNVFSAVVTVVVKPRGSDRDTNLVTITVVGVNDIPTIVGNTNSSITDKQTVQPFAAMSITDLDEYGIEALTVRISMNNLDKGTLQNLGGFTQAPPGLFTMTGTSASITAALHGLLYVPVPNHIPVPTTVNTLFIVSADDGYVAAPVTNLTTVSVTAVNDVPVISGAVAGQTVFERSSIKPFARVTIGEVDNDTLQPLVVTVTLDNPIKGNLSTLGGFVDLGGGIYRMGATNSGVTAAAASLALRALVFNPTTSNRVTTASPETTQFTITVSDSFAALVVDNTTTVIAIHDLQAKAIATDGAGTDHLGSSVAASAEVVVAGAPQADPKGVNSGAAYIYTRTSLTSTQWTQFQKLVPADGAASDEFGNAVAISGNTIAVGAHVNKPTNQTSGAVYVFERSTTGSNLWALAKKVIPFDGTNGDNFGYSVSVDRDILVVGAANDDDNGTSSGTAFIYSRHQGGSNNWGLVKKITASDAGAGDEFGHAVGVHEDRIIVGSPLDVQGGVATGSAYLFLRNQGGSNNWGQVKKLIPSDGLGSDRFGHSVSIYGDTAVVGANTHDHPGNDTGSAYLFRRDQGGTENWGFLKELLSPLALNNDQFGYSVSLSRDKLIVSLPFSGFDNQSKYGSAYAYSRNSGGTDNWGILKQLERTDRANNDQFGSAVAVGQDTAVVGANGADAPASDSGAIYIYRLKYNNAPLLVSAIPNQTASSLTPFSFALAASTFGDPDLGDTITLKATLATSLPLPAWLTFNAATGTFSGTPPTSGGYSILVTATDEDGLSVSALFSISVDGIAPNVFLTSPTNSAVFIVGDVTPIAATATDPDGTVVLVKFFSGTNLLASISNTPYQFAWSNLVAGSYALTAVATDNDGSTTTSGTVNIIVNNNQLPQVVIGSPTNNSTYFAPANIALYITASDADGSVALLELYAGAVKLGESTSNTLSLVWTNAPEGTNILKAVATDNRGVTNTSLLVNVVVVTIPPIPLILTVALDVPNAQLLLRYDRPVGSLSSDYELQVSEDLVNWTSGNGLVVSESTTTVDIVTERVTVRLNLLQISPQFFRIATPDI